MQISDSTPIAPPEQFRTALLAVREKMKDVHLKMLRFHCQAPDHSITLNQLAEFCELTSTTATSSYSTYAQWIANELRFTPPSAKSKVNWLLAIACGRDGGEKIHADCELVMRPELVATLQAMKWA